MPPVLMALASPGGQIVGVQLHKTLILATLAATPSFSVQAQGAADGQWHYLVQPYAMFPNMKGETGVGDLPPVGVDEDPQDIFDNLQMGAMLFAEARNDSWAFSSDLLYMSLESDIESDGPVVLGGRAEVSQLGWELAFMRRLAPWFELGLGATYNKIDADVEVDFAGIFGPDYTLGRGLTEEWIDPTIVARATFPFGDKWFLQSRVNLGGFGVGSDLMWQLQVDLGYRHSDRWSFAFGYRVIDIDYDQGRDSGRFIYDMQTFGPVLKVGYGF
jgi:hypothetical protein